jgi:nicotinamidase/pyrazinamidase
MHRMSRVLIICDVQNDFCEGGALAVAGGAQLARDVSAKLAEGGPWDHIVATKDFHIDPGSHFQEWPVHCVAGTAGSEFHPELATDRIEAVFHKGAYAAAYSGFEGVSDGTDLAQWLREHDVTDVDLVGIATDFCIRYTGLDAARMGFATTVLTDLTAAITPDAGTRALAELAEHGVTLK